MRKMYSKKQIEEIAKSSVESGGGKVYLRNIARDGEEPGYIRLFASNNTPLTKDSLTALINASPV